MACIAIKSIQPTENLMTSIETVTNREKNGTALLSVLAIIFLTLLKASVAILTGSLGLLAEAAHSLMDLVAAGVTFFAVRISGRPADSSHTYGHGKYENLSALVEVVLLLFACAGIIYEAIQRLFFKTVQVQASPWSFLVMGIAVAVNIILARRLRKVAKKYGSQALEAEGLDFFNDVWSSAVVILSLLLVMAADKFAIPWLAKADSIAGVVVAGLIANSVLRLGRRAVGELLDEVPENLQDEIMQAARLPGVEEVRQVRVRRSGNQYFADLTLAVSRSTSSEHAHQITDLVEKAIQSRLPTANVLVHIEPIQAEDEQLTEALHALGERFGLGVHHIHITDVHGRQILTVHLDVAEEMQLEEAHTQASAFEKAVSEAFPAFERVWTHLEPVQRQVNDPGEAAFYHDDKIEQLILELPHVLGVPCEIHEIILLKEKDRLNVSFHCMLYGETSIQEAHELSERMESALCDQIPSLETVLIHMEPLEQVE
jgi:cation diffusion facilitator family transporter